jgi:hypothetical protein
MFVHTLKCSAAVALVVGGLFATIPPASAGGLLGRLLNTTPARQVQIEYNSLVTRWIGIAVSPNRKAFEVANQNSEAAARNAAKFDCEQATGHTCAAVAVPMSWDASGITCAGPGQSPVPFVAGSGQNAALEVAFNKALAAGFAPSRCTEFYQY